MIETERLHLVPFTRDQAARVAAGDREGQAWTAGYPRDDDQDVARMILAQDSPGEEPFAPLQIVDRGTGLVVGAIGFLGPPDADGNATLGYGIAPEAEGRGYTTEALRALLAWAFGTGRVVRVLADTTHANLGSQRVMEKAGMRRTGSDEELHHYAATLPAWEDAAP